MWVDKNHNYLASVRDFFGTLTTHPAMKIVDFPTEAKKYISTLFRSHDEYKKEIQKIKMFDLCDSLCVPSNFVFIEENWKERLLVAFSQCDDWSWLLKSELNIIKNKKIFDENIDKVNVNNNS